MGANLSPELSSTGRKRGRTDVVLNHTQTRMAAKWRALPASLQMKYNSHQPTLAKLKTLSCHCEVRGTSTLKPLHPDAHLSHLSTCHGFTPGEKVKGQIGLLPQQEPRESWGKLTFEQPSLPPLSEEHNFYLHSQTPRLPLQHFPTMNGLSGKS